MKRWHIYYIPNYVRTYENLLGETRTVYGKVGRSKLDPEVRYGQNAKGDGVWGPQDMTGYEIFAWARTFEESKLFEKQYQVAYDCLEPWGWQRKGRRQHDDAHYEKLSKLFSGVRNPKKCRAIKVVNLTTNESYYYDAIKDAAIANSCLPGSVSNSLKSSNGYHKGYHFSYVQ